MFKKYRKIKCFERIKDYFNELKIQVYKARMVKAKNDDERLFYWNKMTLLILSRSPAQIARMERARGLA